MQELAASYFDGRSARGQPVRLRLHDGRLHVTGEDTAFDLPVADVLWPERTRHGPRVAELPDGGSLQCTDAAAWDEWRRAAGQRDGWVVRLQQSWRGVLACVVGLVLAAYAFQQWGVPAAARAVAAAAPAQVDAALGQAVLVAVDESLMRPSRLPAATQQRIRAAFAAHLQGPGSAPLPPWQLLFRDSRIGPNALALPGGTLILTDQLVALVDEDQEVITAVLGHELGHVRHRHGLRMVVQVGLLGALSSLVLGDFSTVLASAPVLLGQANYSRAAEREADAEAVRLLRAAGISPAVMLRLFERLDQYREQQRKDQAAADPAWWGLAFATHPADAERIRFFEQASQHR